MALERAIAAVDEMIRTREEAQGRAAEHWRDVVRRRLDDRVLLPLHVEDRALLEHLRRADDLIKHLLRQL